MQFIVGPLLGLVGVLIALIISVQSEMLKLPNQNLKMENEISQWIKERHITFHYPYISKIRKTGSK